MKHPIFRITLHSLCIISISIIFCKMIPYDFANLPNLGVSIDWNITDFYNMVANDRYESKCDTNVVLVDIGSTSRKELVDVLELIYDCEPLAIGLDVIFDSPKDESDYELVKIITEIPNLVLASSIDKRKRSFFDNLISDKNKGFAEIGDENKVIRQLYTNNICGSDTLHSFASQIVNISGLTLYKQSNNGDYIIYPSIEYDTIHINDIEQEHERLRGKIVLIGTLANNEDIYYTPIDKRMNGVCVHAHIISTILSKKSITHLGKPIQWIAAFIVIFIMLFMRVYFMFSSNAMGDFLLRIMQLFLVWLFIYISYLLFINFQYYCELSIILLSCISLLVADAWQAGLYVFEKARKKWSAGIINANE